MTEWRFILIEKALFNAHAALKNYGKPNTPHYLEDTIETAREVNFKNDNKTYYLLSWDEATGKPTGILPRYSETGNNPKVNKIMRKTEVINFIESNIEIEI